MDGRVLISLVPLQVTIYCMSSTTAIGMLSQRGTRGVFVSLA